MKIIPIFLILLLSAAWAYTSWHWYTCDIKGFCDETKIQSISEKQNFGNGDSQIITGQDVLSDLSISWGEKTQPSESAVTAKEWDSPIQDLQENITDVKEKSPLCDNPLLPTIALGQINNVEEVKKLEAFLTNRYDYIDRSPGKYDDTDFEIVKKFQEEFRSDVLEPWGLIVPSWFVGTTTVKKINEIACL